MSPRKLDPGLWEAVKQAHESSEEKLPVFVRLAPDASASQLAMIQEIVGRVIRYGEPTVVADLSTSELERLCENPAVLGVRLARKLQPLTAAS